MQAPLLASRAPMGATARAPTAKTSTRVSVARALRSAWRAAQQATSNAFVSLVCCGAMPHDEEDDDDSESADDAKAALIVNVTAAVDELSAAAASAIAPAQDEPKELEEHEKFERTARSRPHARRRPSPRACPD